MPDEASEFPRLSRIERQLERIGQDLSDVRRTLNAQSRCLVALTDLVCRINQRETTMASDITDLTAQVQNATTIEESAVQLITGLAGQIADLKNDPAALQALSDQLKASTGDLSAAITANMAAAASSGPGTTG